MNASIAEMVREFVRWMEGDHTLDGAIRALQRIYRAREDLGMYLVYDEEHDEVIETRPGSLELDDHLVSLIDIGMVVTGAMQVGADSTPPLLALGMRECDVVSLRRLFFKICGNEEVSFPLNTITISQYIRVDWARGGQDGPV